MKDTAEHKHFLRVFYFLCPAILYRACVSLPDVAVVAAALFSGGGSVVNAWPLKIIFGALSSGPLQPATTGALFWGVAAALVVLPPAYAARCWQQVKP